MTAGEIEAAFPHFYPDESNTLDVNGEISEEVFNAITAKVPTVIRTGDVLCLNINSPGGEVEFLLRTLELLQTERENIIGPLVTTVGGAECKSAAAELLIAGDYAVAGSDSRLMFHFGGATPPSGMDPEEAFRCMTSSIRFRVEFAKQMVALRLIRRALICKGRQSEIVGEHGDEGWENISSGRAALECINRHGGNRKVTQQCIEGALASLCGHIDMQDISECLASKTPRLQGERLMAKARPAYEYIKFVAEKLCLVHIMSTCDIKYSAEEAYWVGFVDEVQDTNLPNTREWIEETCLD
jgi:ATP-dependent protease ClpP protease subunit